ncbi:3-oxoacyl-ACP reductase [Streptomyces spiroverticillatus]|uniref:3-oxoacyl-ACP reductase n=1 Tax=Streptomyces finlayi TaxID=67296 RepID=A0A919C851_9ACTN|nr:3-oxoacyl-ACP reductase [Streptomyces finlayi]GGZ89849.1 3-oxoacyl-ACP reductase [Streptomyces spiroverticillatus]GHC80656.1 3-oxoacyl-ACP reductase [Streptomyces finlayi]
MADRYLHFTGTAPGRFLTRRLGLPQPASLLRWSPERPVLQGELLHLTAGLSAHTEALGALLPRTGLRVVPSAGAPAAVVLDATGVVTVDGLADVHAALQPVVRTVASGGRLLVLGSHLSPDDPEQAAVQEALGGFVRSLAKEIGRGRTAQLLRLAPGGLSGAESTLRFLLSPKSAYVSGQVVQLAHTTSELAGDIDWERPLAGRTALVTGAARGIGAAVAATLARDGAHVVCLDVPQVADDLERTAVRVGGAALPLDITAPDAAERIAATGPVDVLVHNAGITRDKKLANMTAENWSSVLDVNLGSVIRTTQSLVKAGVLGEGARIVATSSIAGIAGNAGQTNYAASKAGVAGLVRALAPGLAAYGITVNAVAPGFIETNMTASVPLMIREAGRRMNSLGQGGLPEDVAETTAWLAHPGSGAVTGQVVRVCGQSLLGA